MHAYLANMRVLDVVPVETLVAQAGHLYQRFKPDKLIRTQRIYFRQCALDFCIPRAATCPALSRARVRLNAC